MFVIFVKLLYAKQHAQPQERGSTVVFISAPSSTTQTFIIIENTLYRNVYTSRTVGHSHHGSQ